MKVFIRLLCASLLLSLSHLVMAEPVDINSADAQTLAAAMVGVGEKRAEAIIAYREQHGPFASVEDLIRVSGIGPKVLEDNRDKLRTEKE
ncbi:MAG: ComEA family DNA-binding protein [Thiohalomonadaceae bacterium]